MEQLLVISAVGGDPTAVVQELTRTILDCGGNIKESRMAALGSEVGMLLLVRTEDRREELAVCLALGGSRLLLSGSLSPDGVTQMKQRLEDVAREFDGLLARDASLPASERVGVSLVLAQKPWLLRLFGPYRRAQDR